MTKFIKSFRYKLNAFIAIPLLVANLPVSFMGQSAIVPSVTEALQNSIFDSSEEVSVDAELQEQADKIDAYFAQWNLPLTGYGYFFAETAKKYDLDPFLLPAIAMRETTGGKNLCKTLPEDEKWNPYGWGSCKIGFSSFEEAIDTVGMNLAGQNPNTAFAYADKDVKGILQSYNPPSVVPTYAYEVMDIMDTIATVDTTSHKREIAMK
jgi:hypothetical protein